MKRAGIGRRPFSISRAGAGSAGPSEPEPRENMRALILCFLWAALLTGGASPARGQTPPGTGAAPEFLPPCNAPAPAFRQPRQEGDAVPGLLQSQLEAQQAQIDALSKMVGALTEKLQGLQPAAAPALSATQPAPSPSDPAGGPPAVLPATASEELQSSQVILAELRREQAAAQRPPTPEQLQKQLELQQQQIEVLNKMVRLLAAQLEKVGPVPPGLQADVATLEARSRRAAQRD